MRIVPNNAFFENVEQMLSEGNNVEFRCFGRSMQPYLRGDGSEVIVASPFLPEELIPGTIVLFRYHGKYLCHRIVDRKENKLLIQGDGVVKKQERITVSEVMGIVRIIIRNNKKTESTQSKAAQRYWRCWLRLSPIRRYLLLVYRMIRKIGMA